MNIKDKVVDSMIRAAVDNLMNRKQQLDDAFNNGEINYDEYEKIKYLIQCDLYSLCPIIDGVHIDDLSFF
jgi:hypothetical protein